MKKTLLFVLALAVIPVGVDAQNPSADYWRARAEAGEAIAQYNLGVLYAVGRGVPQDDAEAVRWYRLAAEQGDADAQNNLGFMYANGLAGRTLCLPICGLILPQPKGLSLRRRTRTYSSSG